MAYNFVRASSQYLNIPSLPAMTSKISVNIRVRMASNPTGVQNFVAVAKSGAGDSRNIALYTALVSGVQSWLFNWKDVGGSFAAFYFSHTPTVGTWYTIGFSVDFGPNPDTCIGFLDGVSQTLTQAGPTNTTPMTGSTTAIGCLDAGGSRTDFFNGDIADVVIVSDGLVAEQFKQLAKGYTPQTLNLGAAVVQAYAPLVRGLNEIYHGRTVTNGGSATVTTHPRVVGLPW